MILDPEPRRAGPTGPAGEPTRRPPPRCRRLLPLLLPALLLTATSACRRADPPTPDADRRPRCEVYVSVSGGFDARAEWRVNLVSAPEGLERDRPPDLPVGPGVVAALNDALPEALHVAVRQAERRPCRDDFEGPPPVPPVARGAAPAAFALHAEAGGYDEVGGNPAGTELRLTLYTLGLPADARARRAVRIVGIGSAAEARAELAARTATAVAELLGELAKVRAE